MITVFLAGLDMDFHLESKRFKYMHYVNSLFLKLVRDNPSALSQLQKKGLLQNRKVAEPPMNPMNSNKKIVAML